MNWNLLVALCQMNNWEQTKQLVMSREIGSFELPKKEFKWLKTACHKVKQSKFKKKTSQLAGHIKEEYHITKISKPFTKYIIDCCVTPPVYNTWKNIDILSTNAPLYIEDLWCNFQKKYEFNPPHMHSGLVSFVIFIQIPYDLEKEEKYFPDVFERGQASKFGFINSTPRGNLTADALSVDKTFEGRMLMFNASQMHYVSPFYTSDDYRLTVSGNIRFKI